MKRRKLIAKRKTLRKTQYEVANSAGLDRAYYTLIENGLRNPSTSAWQRIFKALNISEKEMGEYMFESIN